MKKKKKTLDQIEKEKKENLLRERLQKAADKKSCPMSDFSKNWNAKNKEKITEMVKLQDVILIRFGNTTLLVNTDNLYL